MMASGKPALTRWGGSPARVELWKQLSAATSWSEVDCCCQRTGKLDSLWGQLDVNREEGSCITWVKLQCWQWPGSGSARTPMSQGNSCWISRLRGLLDGLHDLSKFNFMKLKKTDEHKLKSWMRCSWQSVHTAHVCDSHRCWKLLHLVLRILDCVPDCSHLNAISVVHSSWQDFCAATKCVCILQTCSVIHFAMQHDCGLLICWQWEFQEAVTWEFQPAETWELMHFLAAISQHFRSLSGVIQFALRCWMLIAFCNCIDDLAIHCAKTQVQHWFFAGKMNET